MFEQKVRLIDFESHVSKKTGNAYSIAFIKLNDRIAKVMLNSDSVISKDDVGKEGVAVFSLNVYNMEVSVRLKEFRV